MFAISRSKSLLRDPSKFVARISLSQSDGDSSSSVSRPLAANFFVTDKTRSLKIGTGEWKSEKVAKPRDSEGGERSEEYDLKAR